MQECKITIVGAGLCGTLLAIRLAQKGYEVHLLEKRPDLRKTVMSAGRSINLALSDRGIKALQLVGLKEEVEKLCIPMNGRLIHTVTGETVYSPYSGRINEHINSVSRGGLNGILLDKAETYQNISLRFNFTCENIDTEQAIIEATNNVSGEQLIFTSDIIFGTDGAGSEVRRSMFDQNDRKRANFSQDFLEHGYLELTMPSKENGGFRIEKNALHIWPRGSYMLIALPNLEGSFTVTLFLANKGGVWNFEQLKNEKAINNFFKTEFPDALEHMPDLANEFLSNPIGKLGTIKCYPWQAHGKTLLMGDAAHAVVPFYGQGMNASFEDVVVFDKILDEFEGNWNKIFEVYQQNRKEDTDAIADLAVDNFYEMRDQVANPIFMKKRKLEMALESNFPYDYYSKYSMVTFRDDMSYSEAMKKGRIQDEILLRMCTEDPEIGNRDLNKILEKVLNETQIEMVNKL